MDLINNNTVFKATLWGGHQFGFYPSMVGVFYPGMAEEYLGTMLWRYSYGDSPEDQWPLWHSLTVL